MVTGACGGIKRTAQQAESAVKTNRTTTSIVQSEYKVPLTQPTSWREPMLAVPKGSPWKASAEVCRWRVSVLSSPSYRFGVRCSFVGAGWTIRMLGRESTAHFVKKRCAEISAQGYLRTVDELYDVIAVKERVQPPNSGLADNCRSMNANKLLRVKFVLQTLNRLPRNVGPGSRVNHDVFVGRFDPEDLVDRHENKAALISNRESGKPAAFVILDRNFLQDSSVGVRAPEPSGAFPCRKACRDNRQPRSQRLAPRIRYSRSQK